jgi:hypothetical protein
MARPPALATTPPPSWDADRRAAGPRAAGSQGSAGSASGCLAFVMATAFLARITRRQPGAGLAAVVLAASQRGRAFQQQGMDEGLR